MAENTRLKELTVEVSRLKDLSIDVKTLNDVVAATNRYIKRLLETMTNQRSDDNTRFETVETILDSVLQSFANLQSGSKIRRALPFRFAMLNWTFLDLMVLMCFTRFF